MLRRALDAFVARDVERAREAIADEDDEVDALYDQVYRELLDFMIDDPQTIERATWLLWVAPQPGAHRRPRDEHLRARHLQGDGRAGRDAKRLVNI